MNNKETRTESIGFRTTEGLKRDLEGYAVDDMRTLGDFIHIILVNYVKKRSRQEEKE